MTDLLLDSRLAPEQQECLEVIRQSAHALLALLTDLLELAGSEAETTIAKDSEFRHQSTN